MANMMPIYISNQFNEVKWCTKLQKCNWICTLHLFKMWTKNRKCTFSSKAGQFWYCHTTIITFLFIWLSWLYSFRPLILKWANDAWFWNPVDTGTALSFPPCSIGLLVSIVVFHWSIYIFVFQHGGVLSIQDKEGLSVLDLTMKDRPTHVVFRNTGNYNGLKSFLKN